jgi:hypothetical protein
MLTGSVPWADVGSPMQIIYLVGVLGQRPPLPRGAPPALAALIGACWAESPAARPAFPEVLRRLRAARCELLGEGAAWRL